MKKSAFGLVAGFAVLIISLGIANATTETGSKKDGKSILTDKGIIQEKPAGQDVKVIYTCSMHPAVSSDKPGKCPTCGMNLVKKDAPAISYTCPMHADVVSDKAGKCPKCGMNLEKKEITMVMYTCPMDPEVKSDKAGKCPNAG
jgi:uncharacterized protein with PIN domain